MKKQIITLLTFGIIIIITTSGIKEVNKKNGKSGVTSGCSCHSSAKTGTVTLTGIPDTVYAGTVYTFNVTYNAGITTANWGLDVGADGGVLGTGTNTKVKLLTSEIVHNAPTVSAGTSYTYSSLSWTAPATAGPVTFSFAALAGNGDGKKTSDHQSAGTFNTTVIATTPVRFLTFNTIYKGDKKVQIAFTTATEINTDYFEIERCVPTEKTFLTVNKIIASGNSNSLKSYSFEDKIIYESNVAYRIKAVDKNGTITFSEIKTVKINTTKDYVNQLYPNPSLVSQSINIQYTAINSGNVLISLYNMEGKLMNSLTTNVVKGWNELTFKKGTFISKGQYYLIISNNKETISKESILVQ